MRTEKGRMIDQKLENEIISLRVKRVVTIQKSDDLVASTIGKLRPLGAIGPVITLERDGTYSIVLNIIDPKNNINQIAIVLRESPLVFSALS